MSVTAFATQPLPTHAKSWALPLAVAVLLLILVLPTPEGLPVAGQRILAVFGFAVVVWVTEALDYAVSAIVISALMAFLLGMSPNPAKPQALLGTVQGLTMSVTGFSNTALILVAAALFLAAAMTITGLDRRIALFILSHVGTAHQPSGDRRHPGGHRAELPGAQRHRARRRGDPDHAGHRRSPSAWKSAAGSPHW